MLASGRLCSLIPGLGVKLSITFLAGPTVLSAVGACPPHDGVRQRWWINVASAVSLIENSQKNQAISPPPSSRRTSFPALLRAARLLRSDHWQPTDPSGRSTAG